jgi:TolA-binding protein
MPRADTSEDEIPEYGNEDFGGYDYEDWDWEEGDEEPSLALPPGAPSDIWSGDLIEPFMENGEAFLPDSPPEEAALALAEPLPEPEAPELPEPSPPVLAEEPSPEEPSDEALPQEELLAEEPSPEEPPVEEPPPAPAPPPPPPRIVRPSEPMPPPPPAREILPMPPVPLPDLPARNPPVLTPGPELSPGLSSRIARALAGQTVEVPFRGTGWVYLGESASKRGMDYLSRRLDGEGQTFVFKAAEAGVYELKFYRQDFIRDYIINDLVTVIVEEAPAALSAPPRPGAAAEQGVVTAEPRWPALAGRTTPEASAAPPETQAGPVEAAAPMAAVPETVVASGVVEPPLALLPQDTAAEEYLRRAREEYQEGRFPQSMAILDQFLERFPLGSDEAYWLYAQLCEKQGPSRDIRLALDYYRRLTAEYPQSSHYSDARRRIAYLERYYINIR